MKSTAILICVGVVAGCQGSPKRKTGHVDGHDAGTDSGTDGGFPQEPPITAKRNVEFPCNTAEAPSAMDSVQFEGSAFDQLVIRETSPCQHTVVHKRTDTGIETPLFTGAFSFGEHGRRDYTGALLACASQIDLSAPTNAGTINMHLIQSVTIACRASSGGTWSQPVTIAGPGTDEWAAWVSSVQPTGAPGQYQVKWVRDFSLFPFNLVDDGRPPTDGIYMTTITVGAGTISVGATTKVSDSVLDQDMSTMYQLPNGQMIPYNKTSEFALPEGAAPAGIVQ